MTQKVPWSDFIPGTTPRKLTKWIFFQPLRSWHSNTYAGEGLEMVNGDRSGCWHPGYSIYGCSKPLTVTHRCYWHEGNSRRLSAFLSYPNGMGACNSYFWEIYPVNGDIERFSSEDEMERRIIRVLNSRKDHTT